MLTEIVLKLNYPEQSYQNGYYAGRIDEQTGFIVANMVSCTFVQFFPWGHGGGTAHEQYANFIGSKATAAMAQNQSMFATWPYLEAKQTDDLLLIKCLIEEGRNKLGEKYAADHHTGDPDPTAGEALE